MQKKNVFVFIFCRKEKNVQIVIIVSGTHHISYKQVSNKYLSTFHASDLLK